jgi:hypothetical protein
MKINKAMKTILPLAAAMGTLALSAASVNAAVMSLGSLNTTGDGNTGWIFSSAVGVQAGSGANDGSPDGKSFWGQNFTSTGTSNGDKLAAGDYTINFLSNFTITIEAFAWDGATATSLGTATDTTQSSWSAASHQFSVAGGSALIGQDLQLVFKSPPVNGYRGFDTITADFTAAVPEPTTTALLGLGGLALILRRRK